MGGAAMDRRRFLQGALGAGALLPFAGSVGCRSAWPAFAGEAEAEGAVFRHGVASGDPLADRVILWTRVTPGAEETHAALAAGSAPGRAVAVDWVLARDPGLSDVVLRGSAPAPAARDFTVKVDAAGLAPGTTYYYGFRALGRASPVGRTRTLPAGATAGLRLAFLSCSNLPFGYFNAYAAVARRPDLDAVLHLGDYLYEYANGEYGDGSALGRVPEPDREIVRLVDYRTRHAQYKRDPDARELHRQHPVIAVWDDHESANDAWQGGAENHDPDEGEGPWAERKAAAMRAWREWMPVRESHADRSGRIYRSFRFGDLAHLAMLDTRLFGRDRQAESADELARIRGPERTLLGAEQEAWLRRELSRSKAEDVAWRLLGQQVPMATLRNEEGEPFLFDKWDGYPETRARLYDHLEREGIGDLVVMTGDVHSSWAVDLAREPFDGPYAPGSGRGSLGVELVTPAVSSPGVRDRAEAEERARALREGHPHVRYADLFHRGYVLLDLDRERAHAEWWHVETIAERRPDERLARAFRSPRGRDQLEALPGAEPLPTRADAPPPAP